VGEVLSKNLLNAHLDIKIRKNTGYPSTKDFYPPSKFIIRLFISGHRDEGNNKEYFEKVDEWFLQQHHSVVQKRDLTQYGSKIVYDFNIKDEDLSWKGMDHTDRSIVKSHERVAKINKLSNKLNGLDNELFNFEFYFKNSNALMDFAVKVHNYFNIKHPKSEKPSQFTGNSLYLKSKKIEKRIGLEF